MENKKISQHDLKHFRGGDDLRYRHWLNAKLIYTPGVMYVADQAEAYWLIDAIASYFGTSRMERAICKDSRLRDLQFWRLEVHSDGSATLSARADSGALRFIHQEIPFTDFPLEYVDIWAGFDGRCWTLYLPSEH